MNVNVSYSADINVIIIHWVIYWNRRKMKLAFELSRVAKITRL